MIVVDIETLTGFDIICYGDATLAGYKLEISFNKFNSFTEKIEPKCYNKTVAAKLMDDMLEYYSEKVKL